MHALKTLYFMNQIHSDEGLALETRKRDISFHNIHKMFGKSRKADDNMFTYSIRDNFAQQTSLFAAIHLP